MKHVYAALMIGCIANIHYAMHDNDIFSEKLYTARSLVAQESHRVFRINPPPIHSACATIEELQARIKHHHHDRLRHIKVDHTIDDLTEIFNAQLAYDSISFLQPYLTTLPRTDGCSTYHLVRFSGQEHTVIEHACLKSDYYYSSNTRYDYYYSPITPVVEKSSQERDEPNVLSHLVYYDDSNIRSQLTISYDNNIVYVDEDNGLPLFQVQVPTAEGAIKSVYRAKKELCCITHAQDNTYALHTFSFPSFKVPHNLLNKVGTPASKLLTPTNTYLCSRTVPSLMQLCLPALARVIASAPSNLSSSVVSLMSACEKHLVPKSILPSLETCYLHLMKDYPVQESLAVQTSILYHLNQQVVNPYHEKNEEVFFDYISKLISNQRLWLEYLTIPSKKIFLSYALSKFLRTEAEPTILTLPCDTGSRYLVKHKNRITRYAILQDKALNNCHYFAVNHTFLRVDISPNKINTVHTMSTENDKHEDYARLFTIPQPNASLLLAISPDGSYLHICVSCPCGSHITSALPVSKKQSDVSKEPIEKHVHAPIGKRAMCLLPSLTEMHKCRVLYDHSHAAYNAARNRYATLTHDGITIDIYEQNDTHVHRLGLPKAHTNDITEALFFPEDSTIACLKRHLNAQNQTVHTFYSFDLTQASHTPNTCSNMPLIAAWAYLSKEQPKTIQHYAHTQNRGEVRQPTLKQVINTLKKPMVH